MTSINFQDVNVEFPIYSASGRSLKKHLIKIATGGQIVADVNGRVLVKALQNFNLTIKDGERIGLVGHNGSGKSTLLRLLAGVYKPSQGRVQIRGDVASLLDISLGIDPEATGRENIYIRGRLLGMSKKEILDKIDDIVDYTELGDFVNMPVRTYSSGMHMRLAFTVSTAIKPNILLMDEWLSVGDESFRHRAEKRLNDLVQSTNILVLASHSRELILQTCNRAIWLEHGSIKMDGAPEDICSNYFR